MYYLTVHVQGFELQKLLSRCLAEGISLWNIRIIDDLEMTVRINADDWHRFQKLLGNKYKVTILSEKGFKPLLSRFLSKKRTLLGIIIFVLLLYYQSCFVSEIRIYGYQRLTESEIRQHLSNAGLYEGCSKRVDLDQVEIQMFRQLEDISWIGITYKGNLAEVTVVEGTEPINKVNLDQPCHIVAAKEGYINKIIAREGNESVTKGDFVHPGDILISGVLPIEDKTYSQDPEVPNERYTHAKGEVYAKIVYRFTYYQEKEDIKKKKTGKMIPGLSLTIGNFKFNTADLFRPYNSAIYHEHLLLNLVQPFPIQIGVNRQWEVKLQKEKREQKSIEEQGKRQAREAIRENIPDSAQILNKSLKFYREENIIKVIIMIEALEEIGKEQGFTPATIKAPIEMPEEGLISFGKSTN